MMLKDPKLLMIPEMSLMMCPATSEDAFHSRYEEKHFGPSN